MAGLTASGFTAKTLNEIAEDVKARWRPVFGSGVDTSTDSALVNVGNPIFTEIREVWEGMLLLYGFLNPNDAEGIALDNIGAITNTPRIGGTRSTVTVQAEGNEGAVIPSGFQLSVQDTGVIFETLAEQTLPAVGSQPLEFTMRALDDGPLQAISGTLNVGGLPSGVTSIVNNVDATLGTLDETDEQYRIGRKTRLAALGAGTVAAIRSEILSVTGVTAATILENDTDITDSNGVPPHSFIALVTGGAGQDIIDAIGRKKGAGTGTAGDVSGTYTDETGQEFTIRFQRESAVSIYVAVTITEKTTSYPVNGDDLIVQNIIAYEATLNAGDDVVLPPLQNAVTSVPGIVSYTLFFDTAPSPTTDTPVIIAFDERADFDSTRITVSS